MHLISKTNFQRMREPLQKDSSFLVFLDRISSILTELGLGGFIIDGKSKVGFIIDRKCKPPIKFSDEEIRIIIRIK